MQYFRQDRKNRQTWKWRNRFNLSRKEICWGIREGWIGKSWDLEGKWQGWGDRTLRGRHQVDMARMVQLGKRATRWCMLCGHVLQPLSVRRTAGAVWEGRKQPSVVVDWWKIFNDGYKGEERSLWVTGSLDREQHQEAKQADVADLRKGEGWPKVIKK